MRLRLLLIVVTMSALAPALPAQGAKDFLKLVPDDALGFAVVRNLGDSNAKVMALTKLVNAPIPGDHLAMAKMKFGIDKGLDEKGSLLVVVLPGDPAPVPVLLVPVTDYKQFLAPLKPKKTDGTITEVEVGAESMLVAKKGNYAALADTSGRAALQKLLAATKDVSEATAPLQTWLGNTDAALIVTGSGVKLACGKLRDQLQQVRGALGALGPQAEFVMPQLDALAGLLKSVETDVPHLALGITIDQARNVTVSLRAPFAKGSGLAKAASAIAPLEGGPLAALPAGPFALAAGGPYPEGAARWLATLSQQLIRVASPDLTKDQVQKLEQAYAQMIKGMRGTTMFMGVGKGKESLLSTMVGAMMVDDAPAYLTGYEKSLKDLGELNKQALGGATSVKKVDVGGAAGLEVTVDMSAAGGAVPKQIIELLVGDGGKMTMTLAAADAKTILFRYTNSDGLKEFVQAYKAKKPGLAGDADVAKTAAFLPAGAQWAVYVSPHGVMELAGRLIGAAGLPFQVPPFPKTPPVGMGIKLSAAGLEGQLAVPVGVLEGIGELTKKFGQ